jgi:demethoxyubiquinone hydroxylase (CLK1/Coq7/Cat5 family)
MDAQEAQARFINLLQRAYSGELAAAYAYRGHWKSLSRPDERRGIQKIEHEEWVHRERVGKMLAALEAAPVRRLELRLAVTGRVIGLACHFIGWFLPMYFAGRLESRNVEEYVIAAHYARMLKLWDYEADLAHMAVVEREHELFFLRMIAGHRLLPLARALFKWGDPSLASPAQSVTSD